MAAPRPKIPRRRELRRTRGLSRNNLLRLVSNLQPRLAQAIDQMLNQIGVIPFGIFPARRCGEVGTESEHFPQLFLRGFPLAELAECRSPRGVRVEEIGHVYANRQLKRLRVLTLAIGRGEQGKAEQARIDRKST